MAEEFAKRHDLIAKMKKKLLDWRLDDPRGKSLKEVRRIRDEIEKMSCGWRRVDCSGPFHLGSS